MVKLLGVKIRNSLSWSTHVTDLSNRAMKMAGMIGRIAKFLSKDFLKMVCHNLIYSHITCCGAVWGSAAQRDLKRLQITLNRAARIILGCRLERKVNELHNMMGWSTVVEYLRQHSIAFFSKKFKKPVRINAKFLLVWDKHQNKIRISHKSHYVLPKIKTETGRRTFVFRTNKLWN